MAGFKWTTLKIEFDERHDFESADLKVLKNKFPHAEFNNIPEAWIIVVDDMMRNMRDPGCVKKVRQEYGQLIVEFRKDFDFPENYKVVKQAESKIYKLDKDINDDREKSFGSDKTLLN